MKKINITFSFRDETGDYSVKVFPFVIKCIVSVIVVFNFIVIAMALPGEISDHVKYSGKEYYKSRCEEKYIDREFDSLHDYLNLYPHNRLPSPNKSVSSAGRRLRDLLGDGKRL